MKRVPALILAAGRGSRLGPLTADRPKCLVRLAGRSLLDWQLAALAEAGVGDITAVTGYRGDAIAAHGLRTIENPRWQETNMATSLFCAASGMVEDAWLVAYSDIVYHPDIPRALLASQHDIAVAYDTLWLALWQRRFADPASDAESFRVEQGCVVEIGRRPVPVDTIQGQYLGLLKFSARGLQTLQDLWRTFDPGERDRLDMTALLSRALRAGIEVGAIPVAGRWCEVDSEHDLALYEALVTSKPMGGWDHDWRWRPAAGR